MHHVAYFKNAKFQLELTLENSQTFVYKGKTHVARCTCFCNTL